VLTDRTFQTRRLEPTPWKGVVVSCVWNLVCDSLRVFGQGTLSEGCVEPVTHASRVARGLACLYDPHAFGLAQDVLLPSVQAAAEFGRLVKETAPEGIRVVPEQPRYLTRVVHVDAAPRYAERLYHRGEIPRWVLRAWYTSLDTHHAKA